MSALAEQTARQPGNEQPSKVLMMTIPEILKELEPYTGRFPMQAMQTAIEQREAITPELLRVLEAVAENPLAFAKRQDYMLHLFALFLLAQFREKRAYAPIVKMFSGPGETSYSLAGDTVTNGLNRILASVYDGDPALLQKLVENEDANEFVRDAAINAFLVLEHSGQMTRDEVVGYFRSWFHGKLQRQHSYVWDGLVCAVADLPAPELLEEVRQAYIDGLVDSTVADLEGIERDMRAPESRRRERHCLITDAINEMESWSSFHPEDSQPKNLPEIQPPAPAPASHVAPQPFIRQPKIGRNDPCPCGSGKKYKKCCGKG
jgi:hypothetical protein